VPHALESSCRVSPKRRTPRTRKAPRAMRSAGQPQQRRRPANGHRIAPCQLIPAADVLTHALRPELLARPACPVVYCRARKAEDHLPPSRPGDTPRQAGLARRPGDGACVSTYGVGVGWHGAFPWQCAGRRRCCGCPAERIARGAFLVAASSGTPTGNSRA